MSPEQLRLRDEVLQVLFWMRGEELEDQAHSAGLALFIGTTEDILRPILAFLGSEGFILGPRPPAGRYLLTDLGIREGGRRFIDNFQNAGLGLAKACAPGCDCESSGGEACQHG